MAMGCPNKKALIKKKRVEQDKARKEKEDMPWSKIVQKTAEVYEKRVEKSIRAEQAIGEIGLKALVIVMDAHVHNLIEPGTYNERLNSVMSRNGLEPINLPEEIPNSKVLVTSKIMEDTMKVRDGIYKEKGKRKRTISDGNTRSNTMDTEQTTEDEPEEPSVNPINLRDMGVSIVTATDFQQEKLDGSEVKELFKRNLIKYRISHKSTITPEILELQIKTGKIALKTSHLITVHQQSFEATTNGISKIQKKRCTEDNSIG